MASSTNPFDELTQLFERMQENFETMARGWETDSFEMTSPVSTAATEETEGEYIRRERRHESVSRAVPLPTTVDEEEISATYNNGVLTVHLPKVESVSQGTQIEVE